MSTKKEMQEAQGTELAQGNTPAISDQAASMIQVIEKAVSNPDVDADKLSQILDVQERIMDRNARMNYTRALAEMAGEIPDFPEGGKIIHSKKLISTYARWDEDINPILRPLLSSYGFHLSFRTGRAEDGMQPITACLSHRDGHSEETTIYIPADNSGAKNSVQAVGSSTSYGKRYAAAALLNITTIRGVDDDGQSAGGPETISASQAADLDCLLDELEVDRGQFSEWLRTKQKVPGGEIENIPAQAYQDVVAAVEKRRQRK